MKRWALGIVAVVLWGLPVCDLHAEDHAVLISGLVVQAGGGPVSKAWVALLQEKNPKVADPQGNRILAMAKTGKDGRFSLACSKPPPDNLRLVLSGTSPVLGSPLVSSLAIARIFPVAPAGQPNELTVPAGFKPSPVAPVVTPVAPVAPGAVKAAAH